MLLGLEEDCPKQWCPVGHRPHLLPCFHFLRVGMTRRHQNVLHPSRDLWFQFLGWWRKGRHLHWNTHVTIILVKTYRVHYVGVEQTTKKWGKCINKILNTDDLDAYCKAWMAFCSSVLDTSLHCTISYHNSYDCELQLCSVSNYTFIMFWYHHCWNNLWYLAVSCGLCADLFRIVCFARVLFTVAHKHYH